jgi:hypothetical protein
MGNAPLLEVKRVRFGQGVAREVARRLRPNTWRTHGPSPADNLATVGQVSSSAQSPRRITVPECFPPNDRLALFAVAIAMAGNDVEYSIRQAIAANPDGATDDDRRRNRFDYKVRIANGFLFEAIATLRFWERDEPEVRKLLDDLRDDGRKCLKVVRGLEQRVGPKTLEHVRQTTFHYPRPDPSKKGSNSIGELAEVIGELSEVGADIDVGSDTGITFRFADPVATTLALRRHDSFRTQEEAIRDAAVAFVRLSWHIHLAYCQKRGILFGEVDGD